MRIKQIIRLISVALTGLALTACSKSDPFVTDYPLMAPEDGSAEISLINDDFRINPLSEGWGHRTFFAVAPTDYSLQVVDGRDVLQCATDNSGSILARHTSIELSNYPMLKWSWKIEHPIESDEDEATKEGDDHPARFFVRFEGNNQERRTMEIIWSNKKYAPGDYKIIGNFHHYVANGLPENVGVWHDQSVDLLKLYRDIGGTDTEPKLTLLGFFCDSDNTGGESLAYFDNVRLSKR